MYFVCLCVYGSVFPFFFFHRLPSEFNTLFIDSLPYRAFFIVKTFFRLLLYKVWMFFVSFNHSSIAASFGDFTFNGEEFWRLLSSLSSVLIYIMSFLLDLLRSPLMSTYENASVLVDYLFTIVLY